MVKETTTKVSTSKKRVVAKKTAAKKKAVVKKRAVTKKVGVKKTSRTKRRVVISAEERTLRIAENAYYRAEVRGFVGGSANSDWLAAEADIDAIYSLYD